IGVAGEIYVGGDGLSRGYLNKPKMTVESFLDKSFWESRTLFSKRVLAAGGMHRLYRTGDLGYWRWHGTVGFLGRGDQQVKIRGYRIEPGEIESHLLGIDGVREAVVIDRENREGEKYLCAYVGGELVGLDGVKLKDILSERLPDYMVPGYVVTLETLPLNANGKIDRKALPEPDVSGGASYVAPRDSMEEIFVEIWSSVLGVDLERVGIDSDFFKLGGHSLKATIMIAKLHKALDIKVPLSELFRTPTIRELVSYVGRLETGTGGGFSSIELAEEMEYYPLSSAQKRLYVLQQVELSSTNYNIPYPVVLEGALDGNKLEETFRQMIRRHESLRTSFRMLGETPVQEIHAEVAFEIEGSHGGRPLQGFVRAFDLTEAPLMRVRLVKRGETEHILMLDMHHIITDGTSMDLFIEEIVGLYSGAQLPPLKFRYRDYSQWQNSTAQREALNRQEVYWLEQFGDEIPVLRLPVDYPRPAIQSFDGAVSGFELSGEQSRGIRDLVSGSGSTLYMVMLSIYTILLSKISGQEDMVVGTPIAARRHADLERIIGMFVNTLAMRNYPDGGKTFYDYLREVQERTLAAFENQEYQFEDLVDRTVVNRDASRNPLFDVMFSIANMGTGSDAAPAARMTGLTIKPYGSEHETSKFDISMSCMESGDSLFYSMEYCTRLFKKETIQRLDGYFRTIIDTVLEDNRVLLSGIGILSGEERKRVLYDFNGSNVDCPKEKTLHQLIEEQVKQTPDGMALVGRIANKNEISITYGEFNQRANGVALRLRKEGVEPGSIVAIMADRSPEVMIGILGILKAGGAYLPIERDYPGERIRFILKDSGANVSVSWLDGLPVRRLDGSTGPTHKLTNRQTVKPTNPAYVIYTSGSTGTPKGVVVEHRSVVNFAYSRSKHFKMSRRDRTLLVSSLCFDASVQQIFITLLGGGVLVFFEKEIMLDPRRFKEYVRLQSITYTDAVPSFLTGVDLSDISSLTLITSGGEMCPVSVGKQLGGKPGSRFYNEYGPTEATVAVTALKVEEVDETFPGLPIGKPVANARLYVFDRWMNLVPLGVAGELGIAGIGVARGYLNNPELTAEKFVTGPFTDNGFMYKTGDRVRWMPDNSGNVEFLGRIDSQIKVRGYRIEPGEIEAQLHLHPKVENAAVICREDNTGLNYLCGYLVLREGGSVDEVRE
ncbi:MAG: amino acid adenylation domain-containing protein, partial [bacterium]|nr:amino acid adenylation domain-containing protein [bacterium]